MHCNMSAHKCIAGIFKVMTKRYLSHSTSWILILWIKSDFIFTLSLMIAKKKSALQDGKEKVNLNQCASESSLE